MTNGDDILKVWQNLSTKYDMPDYESFKQGFLEDSIKRVKAYNELSQMFEMPSYEKFEAGIFGNKPEDIKSPKDISFALTLERFIPPQYYAVGKGLSVVATAVEQLFTSFPTFVKNLTLESGKETIDSP